MTSHFRSLRLQAEYTNDPLMWDYMARRELEMESLPSKEHLSKQSKALEMAHKEERCCRVFEEAVTSLPTGEKLYRDVFSVDSHCSFRMEVLEVHAVIKFLELFAKQWA